MQKGRSAKGAARIVKKEVAGGEYSSATYVICDKKSIINIESFGTKVHVSEESKRKEKKFVVTTNHFHHLREGEKEKNSVLREKYLQKLNNEITEESVLRLATRHRNPAVCRHGRTLASFAVFKRHNEKPRILYSLEEPCKGYKEFVI